MAEIVNLRRARKQRARAEQARDAEQRRLLHGRTKAQKALEKLEKERRDQALRGALIEPNDAG